MLMTIAIAYPMWDVGFEIGVYGKIFFEKIFSVWAVSTALLVALILVPRRFLEVTTPMLVATAFPSLWFGIALIARWLPELTVMGKVVFATGLVIYLGCVPILIYMIVALAYPEFLSVERKAPRVGLATVAALFLLAGFVVGSNHYHLLTCEDFELSGANVPAGCREIRPKG